jgi:hypothetical protein
MGVTGDVFLPGGKKIKPETTVRSIEHRVLARLFTESSVHSESAETVDRLDT